MEEQHAARLLGGVFFGHPRGRRPDPIKVRQHSRRRPVETSVAKTGEWESLRRQFDATTHNESVESIEDIFDALFRRRFADLINQIAQPDSPRRVRPRQSSGNLKTR